MSTTRPPEPRGTPLALRYLPHVARAHLGSRRGLLVLAGSGLVAGLALNWSWLAAAGITPILVGVLPCLAMCALGLCMHRGTEVSGATAACGQEPREGAIGARAGFQPDGGPAATHLPKLELRPCEGAPARDPDAVRASAGRQP